MSAVMSAVMSAMIVAVIFAAAFATTPGGEIRRIQPGDPLQLDHGAPAVERDVRIAAARRDIAMALQVSERVAFDIQLIASRDEVFDDVLAAALREELEQVRGASRDHGVVARAADEGVAARAAHHGYRTRAAYELG